MPERMTPDSTRREGVPARPVRLADGAAWGFARPTVRLYPRVAVTADPLGRPVGRVTVGVGFGHTPEVQRLIDGVKAACGAGSVREQYDAFSALAACLLRRAHEISLPAARELLSVAEAELPRLVREVMAVVTEAEGLTPAQANPEEVSTVE